jgi:hypothetical protein
MKDIEEVIKKWKYLPCSWIGGINITEMSTICKVIYRFSAIPLKMPMILFIELVC